METKSRTNRAEEQLISADSSSAGVNRRQFMAAVCTLALTRGWSPAADSRGVAVVVRDIATKDALLAKNNFAAALDMAISALFPGKKADAAWKQMAGASTHWSVKIETRSPLAGTSELLVSAVLERLIGLGLKPWQMDVWDRRAADLKRADFTVRIPGVDIAIGSSEPRNQADTDATGYDPAQICRYPGDTDGVAQSMLTRKLGGEDSAFINMPTLRQHAVLGIDGAIAAALACVNGVTSLLAAPERLPERIAEIWNQLLLPRHRLTIMDAGSIVFEGGPIGLPAWRLGENALIVGTDPVAVDAAAIELLDMRRGAAGLQPIRPIAAPYLAAAEKAGIGSATPRIIRLNAVNR